MAPSLDRHRLDSGDGQWTMCGIDFWDGHDVSLRPGITLSSWVRAVGVRCRVFPTRSWVLTCSEAARVGA